MGAARCTPRVSSAASPASETLEGEERGGEPPSAMSEMGQNHSRALSAVFEDLKSCKIVPSNSLLRIFKRYLRLPRGQDPIASETLIADNSSDRTLSTAKEAPKEASPPRWLDIGVSVIVFSGAPWPKRARDLAELATVPSPPTSPHSQPPAYFPCHFFSRRHKG